MPRKANLLKSLARGRVRTSFNKYNLFNLYKKGGVDLKSKSLYQQKWTAKQETRFQTQIGFSSTIGCFTAWR